jgi:hypothetical protein
MGQQLRTTHGRDAKPTPVSIKEKEKSRRRREEREWLGYKSSKGEVNKYHLSVLLVFSSARRITAANPFILQGSCSCISDSNVNNH